MKGPRRRIRPIARQVARQVASQAARRVAWLAAGLVASLAANRWLPLSAEDPLRGTFVLLPFLGVAFHLLERWVVHGGGRAVPARAAAGQAIALTALGLAALARPHLGFPERSAAILFGGLLLVLAHRVALQVLALRPLLGQRLQRIGAPFFVLPFLVYLALLPWSAGQHPPDGDEPFYLLMTHSLAFDGDTDLTNNYADEDWRHFMDRPIEPQPGDPVGPGGELYSRHNMLLPLGLAPTYRVAGKTGALAGMALIAAALAWMTLRLARRYTPDLPGPALLAWAAVAFASPLVLYSYQVWVEVPAALLALFALDRILALERLEDRRWGLPQWWGIGLPILLLPLVKLRFMLLAGPLLVLAWWYSGRPKKPLIVLGLLLTAVGGGLLIHNQLVYDNPLKIHSWQELEIYRYTAGDFLEGAVGLFWDSAFGLFPAMPLWLLLLPAVIEIFRSSEPKLRRQVAHLAILTLPYLLIVVPRPEWYGGWSPPFRYAIVALPLLGLWLAPLLAERHRGGARLLIGALGGLTLGLTLLWLAVPGWTYNFADGRTYLLDHLSVLLGADAARLLPSTVRPRPASWIWPLASLLVVPLLWYRPKKLPRPALLGVAASLLLLAGLPIAATYVPTRTIELEDPWTVHDGGMLYPDRWSIERTRYRGGWLAQKGTRLVAPVVPGGERAWIALDARYIRNGDGPFQVEVRAGERLIGIWEPKAEDDRQWRRVELGPVAWPEGAPLVIEPVQQPGPFNGVIVDRAVFEWQ